MGQSRAETRDPAPARAGPGRSQWSNSRHRPQERAFGVEDWTPGVCPASSKLHLRFGNRPGGPGRPGQGGGGTQGRARHPRPSERTASISPVHGRPHRPGEGVHTGGQTALPLAHHSGSPPRPQRLGPGRARPARRASVPDPGNGLWALSACLVLSVCQEAGGREPRVGARDQRWPGVGGRADAPWTEPSRLGAHTECPCTSSNPRRWARRSPRPCAAWQPHEACAGAWRQNPLEDRASQRSPGARRSSERGVRGVRSPEKQGRGAGSPGLVQEPGDVTLPCDQAKGKARPSSFLPDAWNQTPRGGGGLVQGHTAGSRSGS